MAYSVEHILKVESWTATGYDQDDLALDVDVTDCMTNGTPGDECDEWKEGVINVRMEVGIPPSAVTALKVRFYLTSIMTAGPNALLPYTDINSVSTINEVAQDYSIAGQWYEHVVDANFLAELADLGDKFALRLAANTEVAKSKLGEVEIDIAYTPDYLTGITKDKNGSVLGSCKVSLFKVVSEGPPETYVFLESKVSDAVTGAYSFDVWAGKKYMVYAEKDASPHVFDATDNVLEADP